MKDDFSIQVTKTQLLQHLDNEMVTNWYYLIYVRIYNKDKTKYRPAKLVVSFDAEELQEFTDGPYTKQDIKDYRDELAANYFDFIESYDKTKIFYEMCNETIINYNNTFCHTRRW